MTSELVTIILTQLVEKNQRIGRSVLQYRGGFAQLYQERALTGENIVIRAQPRKYTIHQSYAARAGRNVATLIA